MTKAVFIDKDGTLIEDVPFNVDPRRVRLCNGAAPGLRRLQAAGYDLIVVSNQPGIALGYFDRGALASVARHIRTLLSGFGITLAGFYYCPHSAEAACNCRKPAPGLLQSASRDHGIDLHRSWLIGDILNDIEAGQRAGCRTVLIDNGNETEWLDGPRRRPHYRAADLCEAAESVSDADAIDMMQPHAWSVDHG